MMKKGQRPGRHVRRVRTKKGRRKTLVNPRVRRKSFKSLRPLERTRGVGEWAVHSKSRIGRFRKVDLEPVQREFWERQRREAKAHLRSEAARGRVFGAMPALEKVIDVEARGREVRESLRGSKDIGEAQRFKLFHPVQYDVSVPESERAWEIAKELEAVRPIDLVYVSQYAMSPKVREEAREAYRAIERERRMYGK